MQEQLDPPALTWGLTFLCDFVLNQAKEIDNAEAKKKVRKALKLKTNQHQQGQGKGGGSGEPHCPAWKDDPDFVSNSIPPDK